MQLAHPFVLLLIPMPLIWAWLAVRRGGHTEPHGWLLRHPSLGSPAGSPQGAPDQRLPLALQTLAFLLLILALAQPREIGSWIVPPPTGRDIALVIDTSLTMSIDDFRQGQQKITRMAMVKTVLSRFISARTADRFALLAFGSQAALLTPPTFDHNNVLAQLQRLQVGMAGDNTALGDALGLAIKHVRQQALPPVVILVSDGQDSNSGDLSPAEAVAVAHQLGIPIHTLQIGSDLFAEGHTPIASPDPQPDLTEIARLTGGQHWMVRNVDDAEAAIQAIDQLAKTLPSDAQQRQVREWYGLSLAVAVLCLGLAGVLNVRRQVA